MDSVLEIAPEVGELVRARGQQWAVNRRSASTQPRDEHAAELPGRTLVTLTSMSDDDLGDELTVVWKVEPGHEILPETHLPAVTDAGWDDPQVLGAFLDTARSGTIAGSDDHTLQAPFRAGITMLFSSPVAFARTLAAHRDTVARAGEPTIDDTPDWLVDALGWEDEPDAEEAEQDVLSRAATVTGGLGAAEAELLDRVCTWATRRAEPADSKADALVDELSRLCPPGSTTRVIVFTEYRDTRVWRSGVLAARGLGGERLGLLHGGMDTAPREHLEDAFQAAPDRLLDLLLEENHRGAGYTP